MAWKVVEKSTTKIFARIGQTRQRFFNIVFIFLLMILSHSYIHMNMTRKMISQSAELVFVPHPGISHLGPTVEIAKLLVARDSRLFVTVLIIKFPFDNRRVSSYSELFLSSSARSTSERIKFINLPEINSNSPGLVNLLSSFFDDRKPLIRDAVRKLEEAKSGRPDSPRLAGIVVDIMCATMIDVGDEFGVPTYVFFTSGAGTLSLMTYAQTLADEHDVDTTEFKEKPNSELLVPGFFNPVPAKVLPGVLFEKTAVPLLVNHFRKTRSQAKGILVNSFLELESNVILSLSHLNIPKIYQVGPVLNLNLGRADKTTKIITWLDKQPPSSVVFLCFGSMGRFSEEQVKEIAVALERSGVRFLWSLRQPRRTGKSHNPTDYTNPKEVLPEGFLNRTHGIGKVVGWAPQAAILAHPAVGGFVSHSGWNSILESLWFGVPIATWPLYAEQQFLAFELVRELELAVEIKIDYREDGNTTLRAEEIEGGIRSVMEHNSDIRKRVKEMSEKSRQSLLDGGSSYSSLGRFIEDVIKNIPRKKSFQRQNQVP